jgi:hypothetical protein
MSARPLRAAAVPEVTRARKTGSAEPDADGTPAAESARHRR